MSPRLRAVPTSAPLAVVVVAGALALSSCGDGTGPGDGGERALVAGSPLTGTVGGARAEVAQLRWSGRAGQPFAVEFGRTGSGIGLYWLRDAGTGVDTLQLVDPASSTGDTTTHRVVLPAPAAAYAMRLMVRATAGGGGEYRIRVIVQDPAPETAPATLTLGQPVQERIDDAIDVDVFRFTLATATEVVVVSQLVDGVAGEFRYSARVRSWPDTSVVLGAVAAVAGRDVPLDSANAQRAALPAGQYAVIVERDRFAPFTGETPRYRLRVRAVDLSPEGTSATLAFGDTVSSALDPAGDADTYEIRATAGSQVHAFVQSLTPGVRVRMRRTDRPWPDASEVLTVAGAPLLAGATGALDVPASGIVPLRIEALTPASAAQYRLLVTRVDSLPEGRSPTIALDEVVTSRLDAPGDVDVYEIFIPGSESAPSPKPYVNVILERPTVTGSAPLVAQLGSATLGTVATARLWSGPETPMLRAGSGRVQLFPLSGMVFRVRVSGGGATDGYFGPYTLKVAAIDSLPEGAAGSAAVGDIVNGVAIDEPGDLDAYEIRTTAADTFTVRLVNPTPGTPFPLSYRIRQGSTTYTFALGSNPDSLVGPRYDIGPAVSSIEVTGATDGRVLTETAPYRLVIDRTSSLPEHRAVGVQAGETITGEGIDFLSDVDGFTLSAPPGREVSFSIAGTSSTGQAGDLFALRIFQPGTGTAPIMATTFGPAVYTGRVEVPPSGRLQLEISERHVPCGMITCPELYALTGSYVVETRLIDRAPETRAAAFAIGDTLSDAIGFAGDVDEYTFTAAAGDRLVLQMAPLQNRPTDVGLRATVIDPATGGVVATLSNSNGNPLEADVTPFTLATGGTFMLRIEDLALSREAVPYRARLARQP